MHVLSTTIHTMSHKLLLPVQQQQIESNSLEWGTKKVNVTVLSFYKFLKET